MDTLAVAFLLAVANTSLWAYVAEVVKRGRPAANLWWFDFLALASGLGFSMAFGINLFAQFAGVIAPTSPAVAGWAGLILTGLLIGGGSAMLNKVFTGAVGGGFVAGDYVESVAGESVELERIPPEFGW